MENYVPFLTGIKSIKYISQKSFSLSFETIDVVFNVANDGHWKSCRNLLYIDHDVA